ncbi:MAG: 4Fe-4S dicluster domain-containing protein [Candidatus Acidiferrum sp.]
MSPKAPPCNGQVLLAADQIGLLIQALIHQGYEVIGPTIRNGAILYDRVSSVEDLPQGWTDEQQGGKYRLKRRADEALFGYTVGPHSWKKFLFLASARLWKAQRADGHFRIIPEIQNTPKLAFLGVRACELHAIRVQDKIFLEGPYVDPIYKSRRANIFVAAVNCAQAGGTCFCDSMGTGPKAACGYDLSLTEVLREERHFLIAQAGTKAGAKILAEIPTQAAGEAEIAAANALVEETARHMGRSLNSTGLKELLYRNTENPRWDAIAGRCLSCANCTTVCPTCFCSTIEDLTDLTGQQAERVRKWDSCFTTDFSYIHGGSVRSTPRTKFRQWMMHKLAYSVDQFGTSGCVGCGRCITWCPVGIDITEEARAIRESETCLSNVE